MKDWVCGGCGLGSGSLPLEGLPSSYLKSMLQGVRDHCVLGQANIHEQEARAAGRQCGSLAGAGETKNFRQRLALCSSHWIDARQ
jgi:hypothetical protein